MQVINKRCGNCGKYPFCKKTNGAAGCCEDWIKIKVEKEVEKQVGKIINDKAVFLQMTFEVDITSGYVNTDVDYDSRILDKQKQEQLKDFITEFTEKIVTLGKEDENNEII